MGSYLSILIVHTFTNNLNIILTIKYRLLRNNENETELKREKQVLQHLHKVRITNAQCICSKINQKMK